MKTENLSNEVLNVSEKEVSNNLSKETSKKASKLKSKVTGQSLESILQNVSVLQSSKGMKKEEIYKKEIFSDCVSDKDKKTRRRKLRNVLDNFVDTTNKCKDLSHLQKVKKEWDNYYKSVYCKNDYSVSSVASANTNEFKLKNLQMFLKRMQTGKL